MLRQTISGIMSAGVVSATPESTAAEAVELMHARRISCIPVLEDGKPVGIFTERDIVWNVARHGSSFTCRSLREVMSTPVVTVRQDTLVHKAFSTLCEYGIRHLVVVDESGVATGVATLTDMSSAVGFDEFFEFKKVGQIMSRQITRVRPGVNLKECVQRLFESRCCCLVVVQGETPVGIVTERDVARFVAKGRSLSSTPVERVMSTPVLAARHGDSISDAAGVMRERGLRRLVVTDEDGALIGLVTISDIVKVLERGYVELLRSVIRQKEHDLSLVMDKLTEKTMYLDSILRFSMGMGIVATDSNMRVAYINDQAMTMLGVGGLPVLGQGLSSLHATVGVRADRVAEAMEKAREKGRHTFSFEHKSGRGSHQIEAELTGIRGTNGVEGGLLLMLRDVTDRRRAEETIRHMALHDALTGLPNRYMFLDHFDRELARSRRFGKSFALMHIDLDRFKEVNDLYGHHAGDALLKDFAVKLREAMREYDLPARFGGDEFIALVGDCGDSSDAVAVAGRLLANLTSPLDAGGDWLMLRVSIGASLFPLDGQDFQTLSAKADRAMYAAKQAGRQNGCSNFLLYAEAMRDDDPQRPDAARRWRRNQGAPALRPDLSLCKPLCLRPGDRERERPD